MPSRGVDSVEHVLQVQRITHGAPAQPEVDLGLVTPIGCIPRGLQACG